MKKNIFFIITTIAAIYLIKRGHGSAIANDEDLDFTATFNRGLQLTLKALSKIINPKVSGDNTSIFSRGLNDNLK